MGTPSDVFLRMIIAWVGGIMVSLPSVMMARWGENRKVGRKNVIPVDGELAAIVVLSPSSIIGGDVIIDHGSIQQYRLF